MSTRVHFHRQQTRPSTQIINTLTQHEEVQNMFSAYKYAKYVDVPLSARITVWICNILKLHFTMTTWSLRGFFNVIIQVFQGFGKLAGNFLFVIGNSPIYQQISCAHTLSELCEQVWTCWGHLFFLVKPTSSASNNSVNSPNTQVIKDTSWGQTEGSLSLLSHPSII